MEIAEENAARFRKQKDCQKSRGFQIRKVSKDSAQKSKCVNSKSRAVPHVIRKQLIFAHAVSDEVRQAVEKGPQNSNTRRGLSASVVSGAGILKKYRCLRLLKRFTGISRGLLSKVRSKLSYPKRKRLPERTKS